MASHLPIRFVVLDPHDRAVAESFLKEVAACPPADDDVAGRAEFRARWAPWLWARAPGPIEAGRVQAA